MKSNVKLLRSCLISNGAIHVDGECVFTGQRADFSTFSDAGFRELRLDYPKFHKMDNLSKLGFLAAEYLLAGTGGFSAEEADKVGIVVANANSSTDTDVRYDKQVKQNLASPALFVYTLPNIVLGEICIRHGIKGENTLFISDSYDAQAQVSYVSSLFDNELIDNCLGGWIDFLNQEYQAFFYLAGESSQQDLPTYSTENVEMLLN